ncbi:MAG TPA: DUF503 domain-containing protein [Clostridiales bacterium]|nr:DUF503 domain-containing protein [Clostridiales bacterium]
MLVGTLKLTFHLPWANSLKDKRMVVKSICAKLHSKFCVSVAEIDSQDVHRTAVIGVAFVASSTSQIDSVLDHLLIWLENNCPAELVDIQRNIL